VRVSRLLLAAAVVAGVVALAVWRGPSLDLLKEAFTAVRWHWVAIAVLLNFASVIVRVLAWRTVIDQAILPPRPRFRSIFSAFSIGLLGNAALPGRIGELARVAVLANRLPRRRGLWATLAGTVFAHRVFDLIVVVGLVLYVVSAAEVPRWAQTSLTAFMTVAAILIVVSLAVARSHHRMPLDGLGRVRRLVTMARQGLAVLHAPLPAAAALFFQTLGWATQFFAVYAALRGFQIDEPVIVAGIVLLVMNVATAFPLWPGNVGLMQAAVALALVPYGVAYAHGFGFGLGLQAIEASVGVGLGLLFLAREGLSFAMLKRMPAAEPAEPAPKVVEHPERTRIAG
jgi:glycosyltransferase 2 family protein